MVETFIGDSPFLLIYNKCQKFKPDIENVRLMKDFGERFKGVYQTDCVSLLGVSELREIIWKTVRDLKHVHDKVPESYFNIKKELRELAGHCDYFDMSKYDEICEKHNVILETERKNLI